MRKVKIFLVLILATISFRGFSQTEEPKAIGIEKEAVFIYVEQMPMYRGGNDLMNKFLINNLIYPEKARLNGIQGKVLIGFIVEEDGTISNVHAQNADSVDSSLVAEAIRVVKLMPKYSPGKQNGKAVRVRMSLPIFFKLFEEEEKKK